jgi:hypothetical protein
MEMSERWILERPEVDHEKFGFPIGKDGVFLSPTEVTPEALRRAGEVLDALFKLQEENGFEICEDSEHLHVFLDLKNGFVLAYENADHDRAKLQDFGGCLVGYLSRSSK